ncbi:immunity 49 family protein [Streptomyces sp. NPDC059740]|uniref:immunity 49 family protein n=1 Tax=Streptomyces sp. NPDC059740 TaxID=3346926 RepID=UPI0036492EBD
MAEESMTRGLKRLEHGPDAFGGAFEGAQRLFRARCLTDPVAGMLETWESCVTAMQVGSGLFASARGTGGTETSFTWLVGHEKRELPVGAARVAHAGRWLSAFWLALVCREKRRVNELCEVPVSLLRGADGAFDPYMYHWVEALQAYWTRHPSFEDKLVAAVEGTDPEVLRYGDAYGVLRLMYPPMAMLTQLALGDEARFNEELANALRLHREYWTQDEDRELDLEGLVALGPLALAGLAKVGGLAVTVESEYLPMALLDGEWVGEFPT